MKNFHLGDILSITTGTLISPRKMEGVYDILGYMTGESLYTHQLPRVAQEAEPVLLALHPQLADADLSGITAENWEERLLDLVQKFGEMLPVPTLSENQHERIDPLSELIEKVHPDRIIAVSGKPEA